MKVTVNGLDIMPSTSRGDGNNRVPYCIGGETLRDLRLPSLRVFKRLAREYLQCEFEEDFLGNIGVFYYFIIDGGITPEKLAAFLAAVVANSSTSA